MTLYLFASLATNVLAAIALLWLAARLAVARADLDDANEANLVLGGVVNGMKSDAAEGRKVKKQREAALRKAMAVNSARKAEKAKD